ncbi:MAG TPA: hypothetical protein VE864_09980, partial [Streptosporangiaceae bacterium]|nr:hypothetical protein [Streptosporangiaceae bacterium]
NLLSSATLTRHDAPPGRIDHLPVAQSVSVPVSSEVNRLIGIGGPVVPGFPGLLTLLAAYRLVFGS